MGVHGDVFRPPSSPMLLSVLVGNGVHIGVAFMLTMMTSILHLLNPIKKGQTLTAMIVLYVLSGSVGGYVSARLYKFYDNGIRWKLNALLTATALPSVFVVMFAILNVCLTFVGAATAVSFLTIIGLFCLWILVSAPLTFIGSYFGLKFSQIEVPTKTNQIERIVPKDLPWHVHPVVTVLCGSILPFGSVCIELAFIMSALWLYQIYYVMGFLFAVFLILTATCCEVSIVLCYLQLCSEDYKWWWKSFWNVGFSGFGYLFLYSIWFLSSRLQLVGMLPVMVYLTYMSMISICFGIFCGSIGVLSCFWFTKKIYGAVKVD